VYVIILYDCSVDARTLRKLKRGRSGRIVSSRRRDRLRGIVVEKRNNVRRDVICFLGKKLPCRLQGLYMAWPIKCPRRVNLTNNKYKIEAKGREKERQIKRRLTFSIRMAC